MPGRNQRRDIMSKTEACSGFVDNHDPPRGRHRFQNTFLIQRRNGSRVDHLDRDPLSGQFVRHGLLYVPLPTTQ